MNMDYSSVKFVLESFAKDPEVDDVAVLLSAGIDSSSVLFSLLSAGKKPKAYTFGLKGYDSTDMIYAKKTAQEFGIPHTRIDLPLSMHELIDDISMLVCFGAKGKTDIECGWPMLYAYQQIKERHIFSGLGADGHFCISKKGMIHYRDRIDEFRNMVFDNPRYAQAHIHDELALRYKKIHVRPYMTKAMREVFLGTTWDEVNKPRQKQPILDAYSEEFKRIKVFKHSNFQLGDSGISQHFEMLLDSPWNKKNHKSVVGVYNYFIKQFGVENEIMDV